MSEIRSWGSRRRGLAITGAQMNAESRRSSPRQVAHEPEGGIQHIAAIAIAGLSAEQGNMRFRTSAVAPCTPISCGASNPTASRRIEMTTALRPARPHGYRLSAYERKANDFYPTPSDLVVSLAVGLTRLGLDLPRVALDPCGGDGALRRSLVPFGVDVRLSDLYPERYPKADGYVTSQPLDASDPEHLRYSLELAGAGCTAIITNTPHNTDEACAIVSNLVALVEGQHVDLVAALFRSIWGAEPGRLSYLNRPSFFGEILCCWRPRCTDLAVNHRRPSA